MQKRYNLEFCEHANECQDYCPYICDEHCEWNEEKAFKVEQDWDNDGMLKWSNAKTLKRYKELCEERNHCTITSYGCLAFDEQNLTHGEKHVILSSGGCETMRLCDYYAAMRAKIANECQPYEIYCYEYNNQESFISLDGDMGAIMVIVDIFGADVAKKINRFSAQYSVGLGEY